MGWFYLGVTVLMVAALWTLPPDASVTVWTLIGAVVGINAWMALYYFLGGR